jgi:hypothetical protein
MKRSRGLPLVEGDGEAELVELADELGGEALAIGALDATDPDARLECKGCFFVYLVIRAPA